MAEFAWSGYNAAGDPAHRQALVVDVGRDFLITSEGNLYLTGPGRMQFAEFSPAEFALARVPPRLLRKYALRTPVSGPGRGPIRTARTESRCPTRSG